MPVWLHSFLLHPKHYIWIGVLIFIGICVLGALMPGKGRSGPRNVDSSNPRKCVYCKGLKFIRTDDHREEPCWHCKQTGIEPG